MGKYVIKKSKDNQFYFNLKAANGEIILTSEMYTSKDGAENGIDSVKKNSPLDSRYERKESKSGQNYFILKAANGQIIGTSEMYTSKPGMENGIKSVKSNGPGSSVEDLT
ncbi:YegP family protein [candidate division KSB1 bacterium]|nr:YegP family protein [candidate division KSB1 bacterium]